MLAWRWPALIVWLIKVCPIETTDIAIGLQQIDWPARLQRLTQGVIKTETWS